MCLTISTSLAMWDREEAAINFTGYLARNCLRNLEGKEQQVV